MLLPLEERELDVERTVLFVELVLVPDERVVLTFEALLEDVVAALRLDVVVFVRLLVVPLVDTPCREPTEADERVYDFTERSLLLDDVYCDTLPLLYLCCATAFLLFRDALGAVVRLLT